MISAKTVKKEPEKEEEITGILMYDMNGIFIKYIRDIRGLTLAEQSAIKKSIVTRTLVDGFAYIYKPQNGTIPDKIDVAKFRHKPKRESTQLKTPEIVETYLRMRRGGRALRLKKVFHAKGYSGVSFIFGVLRNGQGIVRVSPTLMVISDEHLNTEESVLIDLITPKLSEITRIDFVATRKNKVKNGGGGLLFASIEDGLVFAKTISRDYEIVGVKQCWLCGKYMNADKFVRSFDTGDGLTHECRKCIERYDFLWGSGWTARHNGATPIVLNKMKKHDKPHFSGINNSIQKL